jgi:hypothetical protein
VGEWVRAFDQQPSRWFSFQDPMADDPFYYQTSVQMVDRWTELNNYVVPNFGKGGHCHVHSTVRA